jgi:hypothetical protein
MTKTFTAEEFSNKPQQIYREADKGNAVTINHSRYPDVVFEVIARPRRAKLGDDTDKFDHVWEGSYKDAQE